MSPLEASRLADDIEARAFVDLYAAAPPALARRIGLQSVVEGAVTSLLAPGLPTPLFNRVIGFGGDTAAATPSLQVLQARYRAAGVGAWWLHLDPATAAAGLEAQLTGQGFVPASRRSWAKMLRGAEPLVASSDLRVEPAGAHEVEGVAGCITEAFGMPPWMVEWLAALHGRPGWIVYVIADAGQPVGGACLYVSGTTGWLGMGSVLESHRRRGGQLASMGRRIGDAAARGCSHIVTETGEPVADEPNPSLANMARAGFRRVASRLNFEYRTAAVG